LKQTFHVLRTDSNIVFEVQQVRPQLVIVNHTMIIIFKHHALFM